MEITTHTLKTMSTHRSEEIAAIAHNKKIYLAQGILRKVTLKLKPKTLERNTTNSFVG